MGTLKGIGKIYLTILAWLCDLVAPSVLILSYVLHKYEKTNVIGLHVKYQTYKTFLSGLKYVDGIKAVTEGGDWTLASPPLRSKFRNDGPGWNE